MSNRLLLEELKDLKEKEVILFKETGQYYVDLQDPQWIRKYIELQAIKMKIKTIELDLEKQEFELALQYFTDFFRHKRNSIRIAVNVLSMSPASFNPNAACVSEMRYAEEVPERTGDPIVDVNKVRGAALKVARTVVRQQA